MSDFGSDLGGAGMNATVQAATKMVDALETLLARIYELWRERTSADYQLKQIQLKDLKAKELEQTLREKYGSMSGYLDYKDLQKSGERLTNSTIKLTKEQFEEIAAMCKRHDIAISSVSDIRHAEVGGERQYVLTCKERDLERLGEVVDTYNDCKRIELLENHKQGILSKGEAMDEVDRLTVDQIDKEIQSIRFRDAEIANGKQKDAVLERAAVSKVADDEPPREEISFGAALNRMTGKQIDKDTTCYIVDAKDPDRYIEAHAADAEYNGKHYIKTEYTVHHGEDVLMKCDDGRFDGRPKNHWSDLREQMEKTGGFSDTVVKFYSKEELEQYRESFYKQKTEEIDAIQKAADAEDYTKAREMVLNKIEENGCKYDTESKTVIDTKTGKPITSESVLTAENRTESARITECLVCAKQYENFVALEQIKEDLTIAEANLIAEPSGSVRHAELQVNYDLLRKQLEDAEEERDGLMESRQDVNYVQASEEVTHGEEITHGEDEKDDRTADSKVAENTAEMSMDDWKSAIADRKDQTAAAAKEVGDNIKETAKSVSLSKDAR